MAMFARRPLVPNRSADYNKYRDSGVCPFPPRGVWIVDGEDVSGPFTAVGLAAVLCHEDPDLEYARFHVLLLGGERCSIPAENAVWSEEEADRLRREAVEAARSREEARRADEEAERERRVREAQEALERAQRERVLGGLVM